MQNAKSIRLHRWVIAAALTLCLLWLPNHSSQAQNNPPLAACGLPTEGTITASVTYSLTANCTQTGRLQATDNRNVNITINGNGFAITAGGNGNYTMLRSALDGSLILNQVTIAGNDVSRSTLIESSNSLTATDTTIRGFRSGVALNIRENTSATLNNVLFEDATSFIYNASGNGLAVNIKAGA